MIRFKSKGLMLGLFALMTMCINSVYSQGSSVVLDSLTITFRNLNDSTDILPPSVDSQEWKNRKYKLDINLFLKNSSKVQRLYVSSGSTPSANDVFNAELSYLKEGDKEFFIYKNQKFKIFKNCVRVTGLVPAAIMDKVTYSKVYAKDINNLQSNILLK